MCREIDNKQMLDTNEILKGCEWDEDSNHGRRKGHQDNLCS